MSTDIEMLPLPTRLAASGLKSEIVNFAERMVEHNVKERDAEIERLRAITDNREAIIATHAADTREYQKHLMHAEARAERLAEALRGMMDKWDRIGDEHGVRQFTGNAHKLFANELRALLRDHDQEGKDG